MYSGDYSDDDYYDDDYDSYGDEYDPVRHMAEDPIHFQMYGYGGFGYDTSHVPKDEPDTLRA